MKTTLLATLFAGFCISGAAFAQSAPAPSPERAAGTHFHDQFAKADKNGDGFIDREEAASHKRLAKDFDAIDTNKDGKLSKEELAAAHAAARAKHHEEFMAKFKAADKDGDGALSKEEAAAMPHIAKNFDAIDANKDGKVTHEELRAFMMSRHKAHASAK